MDKALLQIEEPSDYFEGIGKAQLPTPTNVLVFLRKSKDMLQQEALQNRSHHRFVLAFNFETDGHIHVDNLVLPFKPGQALLILPYQFHHFSRLASSTLKWLFFTFELEPRTFLEPLRNRVVNVGIKTKKICGELVTEWPLLHAELQAEQLQTKFLQLLLSLKQDRRRTAPDLPPEPKDDLLRDINRQLAGWRGRTVRVADLAEALSYSESRLRVLFKEHAGIPLGSYIKNYRLNRAMALLRTSRLSIADIAEEAGFGSPQAFSRLFRKEAGVSPRIYRNN